MYRFGPTVWLIQVHCCHRGTAHCVNSHYTGEYTFEYVPAAEIPRWLGGLDNMFIWTYDPKQISELIGTRKERENLYDYCSRLQGKRTYYKRKQRCLQESQEK
jgi:hypothetical protein